MGGDEVRVEFDESTPLRYGGVGHNRWHPDIPPIATVTPGEVVVLRTREGSDAQIGPEGGDFTAIDTDVIHTLTGPLYVEGAEPGDLLRVEVVSIEPDHTGITAVWPGSGFGMLPDDFDEPLLVHWRISEGVARSPDLPGVTIKGAPFLGIMGVAPSNKRLAQVTAREAALSAAGYAVLLPDARSGFPGGVPAVDGLRTAPPREIGGNLDVRQLTAGSVLTLPVDVPGALFSAGDAHFAQGDGEVTGTAIEITATARLRFEVVKSADVRWRPRYPSFEYAEPPRAAARRWIGTTGIPLSPAGENGYLDLTLCAREALREMIGYLSSVHGLTRAQAYVLISVAGDLRISEGVDVPNPVVSVHLPLDVFDDAQE